MRKAGLVFLFAFVFASALAQNAPLELYVTMNGNLYFPRNTSGKGVFPILWYDKSTDPKILFGGIGFGLTVLKPHNNNWTWKGQVNLSRHSYWDEPLQFKDQAGYPLGSFQSSTIDYCFVLAGTAQYSLSDRFSVGTGLSAHVMLFSLSRLPDKVWAADKDIKYSYNKYYKPVLPALPVEISYKLKRSLFNIRYEHSLMNRLKAGPASYKKDQFGLLSFEYGFKIR